MNFVPTREFQSTSEHTALLRALPSPEPTPNRETYVAEREKSLAFSKVRRANYERYLASQRGEDVDYLPIKLDIENVSRCNFKCSMCVVSDWEKGRRSGDLAFADFKRIIDEQYGLVEIKLQGIGEPLMQGDNLFEMIRYARANAIWVRTTTNASLLHLKDNYRKLIDSGVNEVQISVDGADKSAFEAIRRGSIFEKVLANCRLINGYCDEQGIIRTKSWTVVQRENAHQLPELVDLAAELGFKHHVFSLEVNGWGDEAWTKRNIDASVDRLLDPAELMTLIKRGERLGIKVRFWNVSEKYEFGSAKTLCPWPFERAVVSSDLRVVPCCTIGNPDVYEIDGITVEKSFSKIWHGDAFSAFRRSHLKGKVPAACRNCYKTQSSLD